MGGVAIFLVIVIIIVGGLALFTGLPGAVLAMAKGSGRRDASETRPQHNAVENESASTNHLPEDLPDRD